MNTVLFLPYLILFLCFGGVILTLDLEKLVDNDKNVYELTCVAIKRASQVANDPDYVEKLEEHHDKITIDALNQVLNNEVEYTETV